MSIAVEFDFGPGLRMEERIDAAETDAITERWEFGRWMLTHVPEGGKKLPDGFLDGLAAATGKSRRELKYRRQFAEQFPTREALGNVLPNHRSWHDIVSQALPEDGGAHVSNNSGDNEWYTPSEYIHAANLVMGGIDLDPASSREANSIVAAAKYYTVEDDGLSHPWAGRVWMNPPYARPLIDSFCAKLAESFAQGDVTQALTLTNNATETGWFHALAEVGEAICFPRHRVKFWHREKESAVPLQGQAVVYMGPNVEAFRREFLQFGFTVVV